MAKRQVAGVPFWAQSQKSGIFPIDFAALQIETAG
jgi:hypothetical protein